MAFQTKALEHTRPKRTKSRIPQSKSNFKFEMLTKKNYSQAKELEMEKFVHYATMTVYPKSVRNWYRIHPKTTIVIMGVGWAYNIYYIRKLVKEMKEEGRYSNV